MFQPAIVSGVYCSAIPEELQQQQQQQQKFKYTEPLETIPCLDLVPYCYCKLNSCNSRVPQQYLLPWTSAGIIQSLIGDSWRVENFCSTTIWAFRCRKRS